MTRVFLCASLAALTLALGVLTALVQSGNRARGLELNTLKEECGMIEAINGKRAEEILRRDWGPLPYEPRASVAPRKSSAPARSAPRKEVSP